MKERPILFSAPMVRALLAGTKTQTRRVVKPALSEREWVEARDDGGFWRCADGEPTCYTGVWETHEYAQQYPIRCPYGQPGDRLWVRETHSLVRAEHAELCPVWYWADDNPIDGDWTRPRPSIHMPRWASRITLEVTGVRVERLQEIWSNDADCIAEGIEEKPCAVPGTRLWHNYMPSNGWTGSVIAPGNSYRSLWESINGADSWAADPWVWVVEFRRLTLPSPQTEG